MYAHACCLCCIYMHTFQIKTREEKENHGSRYMYHECKVQPKSYRQGVGVFTKSLLPRQKCPGQRIRQLGTKQYERILAESVSNVS